MSELAWLEKLQYQAAKLVTGTLHLTSKDKLNVELGWKSFNKIEMKVSELARLKNCSIKQLNL